MVYLDNIIFSLQKAGGISVVWKNLIENLLSTFHNLRFIEYENSPKNIFRSELKIPIDTIQYIKQFNPVFSQLVSPKIKSESPFIFHSSYFRICNSPNARNVTTVHDFIYEQGKPTLKQKFRIWLNYRAIKRSDAIVCISENTKKDLLRFIPTIDQDKIKVIYNGVSDEYFQLSASPYPKYNNYVLFVGGRQGYKNFDFVVKALAQTQFNLLVCGSAFNNVEIDLLNRYLPNRYEIKCYPSVEELNKLYNSVFCLVYPSSYEGFGLPILEAQKAGCPVIALSSSSIPEIIGDDALLMNELSQTCFNSKLDLIKDNSVRQRVVELGKINATRFSWSKMASEYLRLYKDLLSL